MNDLMSQAWSAVASSRSCSKMPGGEGIALFIAFCYALYIVVVFLAAVASARFFAGRQPQRRRRIWITHLSIALLLTAGPPAYLYGYGAITSRNAQADMAREEAAFQAWQANLLFKPGQVAATLDQAFAVLPRPLRWNDGRWVATLKRAVFEAFDRSPATEWQAADLDAFAAFPARIEQAGNRPLAQHDFDVMAPMISWDRDRTNLAAAMARCDDVDTRTRDYCREALRFTVRGWCAANRGRCDELGREPAFRAAAKEIGVYDDSRR